MPPAQRRHTAAAPSSCRPSAAMKTKPEPYQALILDQHQDAAAALRAGAESRAQRSHFRLAVLRLRLAQGFRRQLDRASSNAYSPAKMCGQAAMLLLVLAPSQSCGGRRRAAARTWRPAAAAAPPAAAAARVQTRALLTLHRPAPGPRPGCRLGPLPSQWAAAIPPAMQQPTSMGLWCC